MYRSPQVAAYSAKEWLRGVVRQILLFIGIASVLVYAFELAIDAHTGFLPVTFGTVAMCVCFGTPAGLALWLVYRVLRFAIGPPAAPTRHYRPFLHRAL